MRLLAVFVSPFAGLCLVGLSLFLIEILKENPRIEFESLFTVLFLSYSIALIVQVIFVELVVSSISANYKTTFENYMKVAIISCVLIEVSVLFIDSNFSFANFLKTIEVFLFFYVYSLGNALSYNYLYFKDLEK
ncbi:MAG: hypothetical protein U5N85_18850 [Arcicella sp.]|nr:hypothetical protein [Arcicella sp.]